MIKLATINLEVKDIEKSKAFYIGVLGMEVDAQRSHPPSFVYLKSAAGHMTMTTPHGASNGAGNAAASSPPATMEIGFETDNLAAVKVLLAHANVAAVKTQDMGWGDVVETLNPDGHRLVVYSLRQH